MSWSNSFCFLMPWNIKRETFLEVYPLFFLRSFKKIFSPFSKIYLLHFWDFPITFLGDFSPIQNIPVLLKKFYKISSQLVYILTVTGLTYLCGIYQLDSSWTSRMTSNKTCTSRKCSYNSLLIVSFKVISKITVRSFIFLLCWEIFFSKRTSSIQSHPCWIISLGSTILLSLTFWLLLSKLKSVLSMKLYVHFKNL